MSKIVVGVDGSDAARGALDWALAHAEASDEVLIANIWSLPAVSGFDMPLPLEEFEKAANRLVDEMAANIGVEGDSDGPTIKTLVESGHPGVRLTHLSGEADLVVVGSRGYGGFKGMLLGSVGTYLAHHAKCPLTIVRPADGQR